MGLLSIFDIIGPVMVGPSSSHTAGAAKIGLGLNKCLKGKIRKIHVTLYNSFADTGQGHGTRNAIIGGVLGKEADDAALKDSISIARTLGIAVLLENAHDTSKHPNSALIAAETSMGIFCGFGESLGGGLVAFRQIPLEAVLVGRN